MKIIKDLGSKLHQQGDINNAFEIERESEESTVMKSPLLENQLSKASHALNFLKFGSISIYHILQMSQMVELCNFFFVCYSSNTNSYNLQAQ